MTQFGPKDWENRLDNLLGDVIWYLADWDTPSGWDEIYYGLTEPTAGWTRILIRISATPILGLMKEADLTLSERCLQTCLLAQTIVHEMMHAVIIGRRFLDTYQSFGMFIDYDDKLINTEPHVDFDDARPEIGFFIERQFFGGEGGNERTPYRGGTGVPLQWVYLPSESTGFNVTSLHTSKLLSESFWSDATVPRKSDNHFHWNKIFMLQEGRSIISSAPNIETTDEYQRLVPAYRLRNELWRSWRAAWYIDEWRRWNGTLWANYQGRRILGSIDYFFTRRHEIGCAQLAKKLIAYMDWKDPKAFVKGLPDPDKIQVNWYLHAIGLLLMAAIPIRRTKRTIDKPSWALTITPSRAAVLDGDDTTFKVAHKFDRTDVVFGGHECEASELYDPLAPRDNTKPMSACTQLDYLRAARRLIDRIKNDGICVEEQWITRLIRAEDQIRRERRTVPHHKWIKNWPFAVPPYESRKNVARWDAKNSTWNVVR
ncbi:hypothetical protein F5Y16DRAFT_424320 [Xylariaceae sp. FL0255]|nr:hypothetical protein F5Y16DRAFT_424320 [Xylariaceae sp. FL0255]